MEKKFAFVETGRVDRIEPETLALRGVIFFVTARPGTFIDRYRCRFDIKLIKKPNTYRNTKRSIHDSFAQ